MIIKNNKYRLIAVDIDGTLLNNKKELTSNNLNYINKAIEENTIFVISTGRPLVGTKKVSDLIKYDIPLITTNGSLIITSRNNRIIYEQIMENTIVMRLVKFINSNKGTWAAWSRNVLYVNKLDNYIEEYKKISDIEPILIEDNEALKHIKINKLVWFIESEQRINIEALIYSNFRNDINYFTSSPIFMEFVDKKVSKAKAMEILSKYYNIDSNEMIAIGDGRNDLPMIRYAGLGVAMGNASIDVKEQSDYVTVSNEEDGVAQVIKKFILSEESYE